METMKTPGVYVVEKKAFPNSVVEVATAVPAFIGYTQKAENGSQSLLKVPFRISSLMEFEKYFGGASYPQWDLINMDLLNKFLENVIPNDYPTEFQSKGVNETLYKSLVEYRNSYSKALCSNASRIVVNNQNYGLIKSQSSYTLYQHIKLFFANGGGSCYIVSVGTYGEAIEKDEFVKGIGTLEKEQEPTLLVIPEAVNMEEQHCYEVYQQMLSHCGEMKNRFAILDVHDGYKSDSTKIVNFREKIGDKYLNFGSVYYPWLTTSNVNLRFSMKDMISTDSVLYLIVQKSCTQNPVTMTRELSQFLVHYMYKTIDREKDQINKEDLKNMVSFLIGYGDVEIKGQAEAGTEGTVYERVVAITKKELKELTDAEKTKLVEGWYSEEKDLISKLQQLPLVPKVIDLPPSAAMAGIYTMVDNTRGVWKAPANISISAVISPTVDITDEEQKDLNVPVNGKSVNAIRSFIGSGIKVWGARTLDGRDLNTRYINVRRTMIFLEESVKNAARSYVFEPNDANTWLNMKCMVENFLRSVWKRGGLVGASPEEAFSVHVGLGETMTPEDILEGIMRISVLVAISHPAEFIEITFQQQMQKS